MFNFSKKSPKKESLDRLRAIARVFGTMKEMEQKGLLKWDQRSRRLFIAEPLAIVMMNTSETWKGFLSNVFLWQTYLRQMEAWENARINAESRALRKAKAKVGELSKDEMDRIRRAADNDLNEGKVKPPKIEAYEVFIIGDTTPPLRTADDHTEAEAKGQIVAVGTYDPETERTEMAMWEDVKRNLERNSN